MNFTFIQRRIDKTFNNVIIIVSLVVSVLVYIMPKPTGYELMFLHPLIFALFYSFCAPFKETKFDRPSLVVLFVTMLIRYVLSPLLLMLGNYPEVTTFDHTYLTKAMVLMAYEELLVFFVISIYGKTLLNQKRSGKTQFIHLNGNLYLYAIIIISVYFFITIPEIRNRYHFLLSLTGEEYEVAKAQVEASGISQFIITAGRYILLLLLLSFLYKQYKKHPKEEYVVISLLIVGLNMMLVYDLSRFTIMIPTAVLTYLLLLLYPNSKRSILRLVFIGGLVVIGYTSFVKMFSDARGGADNANDLASWANTIQMYFMGQRDVGLGLYTSDQLRGAGILYFFNDFFGQIMFVHNFTIPEFSPIISYNYEYNQGPWYDKIYPNLCAGYTYFGTILSPVITVIFTYLALWFDKLSFNVKRIEYKFLLIYGAIMCSVVMMQFYTMMVNLLVNTIFVCFVIFKINEIFQARRK